MSPAETDVSQSATDAADGIEVVGATVAGALRAGSVVVNDYAGHPFQIDLSNELAARGDVVTHVYCNTNVTPRGTLDARGQDADVPTVVGLSTGEGFEKYNIRRRLMAEARYGLKSAAVLREKRPAACINSNVPVVSLAIITVAAKVLRVRNVLWLQDLQSGLVALAVGDDHLAARIARRVERWCVRAADHVVTISLGFETEVVSMGVSPDDVTTVPNWAPIDEVPVLEKQNPWSTAHGLDDRLVFLYSGTLGIKHRPEALVELARALDSAVPEAVMVVVSESVGVEWIESQRTQEQPLANVRIIPFQSFEVLPQVLASADVMVALLEADAGEFSVPSKVLTYLCAGRPVLGLMPSVNAASKLVAEEALAGLVADELEGFLDHGLELAQSSELRNRLGRRGRAYAERHFRTAHIADRFARVLSGGAVSSHSHSEEGNPVR